MFDKNENPDSQKDLGKIADGETLRRVQQLSSNLAEYFLKRSDVAGQSFEQVVLLLGQQVADSMQFTNTGVGVATIDRQLTSFVRANGDPEQIARSIDCKLPAVLYSFAAKKVLETLFSELLPKVYMTSGSTHVHPYPIIEFTDQDGLKGYVVDFLSVKEPSPIYYGLSPEINLATSEVLMRFRRREYRLDRSGLIQVDKNFLEDAE